MAGKGEVIVNKINLKECKYFKGVDCLCDSFRFWGCTKLGGMCSEHPDCYFKQLKRKEQECEELKQWKKDAENLFKAQIDNTDKITNRYKQALDEIEKIANKQRKFDLTGKTSLIPVINEVGEDFTDILDIINKVKEK